MIPLKSECREGFAVPIASLENPMVLRGCVEVEVYGISRQVHVYDIGSFNDERSVVLRPVTSHFKIVLGRGNIEVLRFPEDGLANVRLALGRVSVMSGFVFEPVIELVVVEIGGDELHGNIDSAHNHQDPDEHPNATHSAPFPAPTALGSSGRGFGQVRRAGPRFCRKYSVIAPIVTS